jgi:diguanylate cyclase (GGDEF)-like protein/PAS domain S-box-containing protein
MAYGVVFSLSWVISAGLLILLYQVRNVPIARRLFLGTLLVSFWILMEVLSYTIRVEPLGVLFQRAKFIGVMFIPPLYVLTAYEYANRKGKGWFYSPWIFFVPCLSLASLLTNRFPYPFLLNPHLVYYNNAPVFTYRAAIGVWIHTYYCYSNTIIGLVILLTYAIHSPRLYRRQSFLIFTGSIISFAVNLTVIYAKLEPAYFDTTSVTMLMTLMVFYWGIFRMPRSGIQPFARDLVIENINDVVILLDSSNQIIDANPAAKQWICRFLGKSTPIQRVMNLPEADRKRLLEIMPGPRSPTAQGENAAQPPLLTVPTDGQTFYYRVSETPIQDDQNEQIGRLLMLHDVTQMQEAMNHMKFLNEELLASREALHTLAYYDPLTGIPNRTRFYTCLEQSIARTLETGRPMALLFMDLDGFKVINDSLGHTFGDRLLKDVAQRLQTCLGGAESVSRFGGDEFTAILEGASIEDARRVAETIIASLLQPFSILEQEMTLGISIGIAFAPQDGTSVEGLVRRADAAMYDAKAAGRRRYSFSSDAIERRNQNLFEMHVRLRKALEQDELRLFLQPQVAYRDGHFQIVGAEALLRWETAAGTFVSPNEFIPYAENNGLIHPIGKWILYEIFRINQRLQANQIFIQLSINLSTKQFENNTFVATVKEIYQANQPQQIRLVFEITESFLLQNIDSAIDSLLEIKSLGIGLALDDFGTGFSSLSYLARLPIDYLKIDQSFIREFTDQNQNNLTADIIRMAKTLKLKTVAEGVETPEQMQKLVAEGCDKLQGYFFSKPLPVDDFIAYVGSQNTEPGRTDLAASSPPQNEEEPQNIHQQP